MELVQEATLHSSSPTSIPFSRTPPRVLILAPDSDYLPPPRVTTWEQMIYIQSGQSTRHHHNSNRILYLMNTTPNLQFLPKFTVQSIQVPVTHR